MLAIGLYLFAALCKIESNVKSFVIIPGSLSAAAMLFMVTAVIFYVHCPRKMTIYEYGHGIADLKKGGLVTQFCLFCTSLATLVHLVFFSHTQRLLEFSSCFAYFLSGAAIFMINRIEHKTNYYEEYNDTTLPFYPDSDF